MKIVIVDSRPVLREGVKSTFGRTAAAEVVGEVGSAGEAVDLLARVTCDVVILDLSRSEERGLWCIGEMLARWPRLPIVIFTDTGNEAYVTDALEAGASGCVLKSVAPGELVSAVTHVVGGGSCVPAGAMTAVLNRLRQKGGDSTGTVPAITERERDVLRLLVQGAGNALIARQLSLSVSTVKSVVRGLFDKFDVSGRTQITISVLENPRIRGLLGLDARQ